MKKSTKPKALAPTTNVKNKKQVNLAPNKNFVTPNVENKMQENLNLNQQCEASTSNVGKKKLEHMAPKQQLVKKSTVASSTITSNMCKPQTVVLRENDEPILKKPSSSSFYVNAATEESYDPLEDEETMSPLMCKF